MGRRKLEEVISFRSDNIECSENAIKTRACINLERFFQSSSFVAALNVID